MVQVPVLVQVLVLDINSSAVTVKSVANSATVAVTRLRLLVALLFLGLLVSSNLTSSEPYKYRTREKSITTHTSTKPIEIFVDTGTTTSTSKSTKSNDDPFHKRIQQSTNASHYQYKYGRYEEFQQEDININKMTLSKSSSFSINRRKMSTSGGQEVIQLTSQELKSYIDSNYFDLIIDVRDGSEWNSTGHIPNATLVPNLADYTWPPVTTNTTTTRSNTTSTTILSDLDPYNLIISSCQYCTVVVYCRTGQRAASAIKVLQQAGWGVYGQLYNGLGVSQWTEAGYALETTPSVVPYCSTYPATTNQTCKVKSVNSTTSGQTTGNATNSTDRCNPDLDSTSDNNNTNATTRLLCTTDTNTTNKTTTNNNSGVSRYSCYPVVSFVVALLAAEFGWPYL